MARFDGAISKSKGKFVGTNLHLDKGRTRCDRYDRCSIFREREKKIWDTKEIRSSCLEEGGEFVK